jgi:hypothetical protein
LGIKWADCLPDTAGYNNGGGQIYRNQEAQAQQQTNNDRIKQAVAESEACAQKRKDHIFKTYAESSACINEAMERGYRETGYQYMDLIMALDARRSQLASQVDKKIITEEDFKAAMAEKISEITSEELKRKAQLVGVAAQQQQANAAQQAAQAQTIEALSSMRSSQPAPQAYVMPTTTNTNCTAFGNSINCQTR